VQQRGRFADPKLAWHRLERCRFTKPVPPFEAAALSDPIRVLLLEDDANAVLLFSEILKTSPVQFEIKHVDRLGAAIDYLKHNTPDVILADFVLPDSRGGETLQSLIRHPAQVPVILLSGLEDEALALDAVQEGAQDYLVKTDVNSALLVRSIRYAIKRAAADRALAAERNLLRSVLDNLVDAIYVKDAEGRYLLGNAAHARQLGLASTTKVIGSTTADLFPEDIARRFRADDEQVMRTGEPIINRHEKAVDREKRLRWLSTTKVPLRDEAGNVVGIIGIGRDITARKLAEEQLAIYTRELQEKNAEMEGDLEMAREVQQAFLPQQFPTFPRHVAPEKSALRFCSKYLPTTTLGGDFFHVLPISDAKAGVLICDVMGHGVRAALVTAIQRALVEELTEYAEIPGEFLTQMNASLVSILRRTKSPMFASAFYVVVDVDEGSLCYSNAGHPRPVHLKRAIGSAEFLRGPGMRPGPALGVFENSRYTQEVSSMRPRDLLLLFTDGLYEVENVRGEFYEQSLLLQGLEQRLQKSTEQIFEQTLEEVRHFSATRGFIDDVCLVGVELIRLCGSNEAGIPRAFD
jgi:sigma-B regulation protein RsbU (phosphoserine phosphatase)